jgi:hypothetical protein
MSAPIFPSFQAPYWNFKWPIKKTPKFNTTVQTPVSGRGQLRIANATFPIWQFSYNISYLKDYGTNPTAYQTLIGFYSLVQGAAGDWLFLDPYDNTIPTSAPQQIGTGDGITKAFSIYRMFGTYSGIDLIQNFVSPPVIYVGGTASGNIVSSSAYTIDQYGTLTFTTAPAISSNIYWSGQFYFRCHFINDSWDDLEQTLYQIWEIAELRFESVLL